MGKVQQKICPYCNKEFTAYHPNKKYCSSSHRMMAYHKRKGYKLVTVIDEEDQTNSDKDSQPAGKPTPYVKPKTTEDFNAGNLGAATLGTMAGNKIGRMLTQEADRPATKGELNQLRNEMISMHREVLRELRKNDNNRNKNNYLDFI